MASIYGPAGQDRPSAPGLVDCGVVIRSLVGLVLTLAIVGSGCSSQPSALTAARQSVEHWARVLDADCPPAMRTVGGKCSVPPGALFDKICSDEHQLVEAQKAEDSAEGKPYSGPDLLSCRKMEAMDRVPHPTTLTSPGRTAS